MAKTKKSEAELYREERKKRIAKAAKQSQSKSAKVPNAGSAAKKTVSALVIVALVGVIVWYFCSSLGVFENFKIALEVGDTKITAAEFSYIYDSQYSTLVNNAKQFDEQYADYGYSYKSAYGFDYTVSPAEQKSNETDEDGNYLTWADTLVDDTAEYFQSLIILYNEAVANNYSLTDEERASIDESIESLAANAHQNNVSINSYLRLSYGKGISEKLIREQMEREAIAQRYAEDKEKAFEEKHTNEEMTKLYNEDRDSYDVVDLRVYTFTPETLTKADKESDADLAKRQSAENAERKAAAEKMFAGITDENSFIKLAKADYDAVQAKKNEGKTDAENQVDENYDADSATNGYHTAMSSLTSFSLLDENLIPDEYKNKDGDDEEKKTYTAGNWAFEDARKAGDKVLATTSSNGVTSYVVIFVAKTQYPGQQVDVRHILFSNTETDEDGSTTNLDEKALAEKKKLAEDVLAKWNALKKEEKTAEKFGELANEYSEDPGSNGSSAESTSGGLYEDVAQGAMVNEFDSWIFDKNRKEGDVEMIESDYGYHIMYYVGNREYSYISKIRTEKTQDDYSSWLEEKIDSETYTMNKTEKYLDEALERSIKLIEMNLESNAASASQTIG